MGPTPSLMVMRRLEGICLKVSCSPLGQYTSISTEVEAPRPKCKRESLHEKKLDWLNSACAWVLPPKWTSTLAPMALRLDFTPSNFILIQLDFPLRSLRNSDGGSLRLMISMSISPSLSK